MREIYKEITLKIDGKEMKFRMAVNSFFDSLFYIYLICTKLFHVYSSNDDGLDYLNIFYKLNSKIESCLIRGENDNFKFDLTD